MLALPSFRSSCEKIWVRLLGRPGSVRECARARAGSPSPNLGTIRSRSPTEDRSERNSASPSARRISERNGREANQSPRGSETKLRSAKSLADRIHDFVEAGRQQDWRVLQF